MTYRKMTDPEVTGREKTKQRMAANRTLKDIEAEVSHMTAEKALLYLENIRLQGSTTVDKLIVKYEKRKLAHDKEIERLELMSKYEKEAYQKGFRYIAGIDEAGRGPLAGPVVAACVILPEDCLIEGVNDSKKLSSEQREKLYEIIIDKAVSFGVGIIDEKIIDEINILNATKLAMKQAIEQTKPWPDMLLIDAVKLEDVDIPQTPIIKGDALSISIAAASILAKVTRDRMLDALDTRYPVYGFKKHKGYGTEEHINAIKKFGICPIHRISFTKNFVD